MIQTWIFAANVHGRVAADVGADRLALEARAGTFERLNRRVRFLGHRDDVPALIDTPFMRNPSFPRICASSPVQFCLVMVGKPRNIHTVHPRCVQTTRPQLMFLFQPWVLVTLLPAPPQ